ncbi:MAG: macro domain-containing protein, partial [Bacteroidota bacterium]
NKELVSILQEVFAEVKSVRVRPGNLLGYRADALVSPGNSFGDMGGGVDREIDLFFRGQIQSKVQKMISEKYYGEIPVGMAELIPTRHRRFRYLLFCPTMRIPGTIKGSIQVYLARRALLVCVMRYNQQNPEHPLSHIAMTSLGTGIGGMPYEDAAQQMRVAWEEIMNEYWKSVRHPVEAPYAYIKNRDNN